MQIHYDNGSGFNYSIYEGNNPPVPASGPSIASGSAANGTTSISLTSGKLYSAVIWAIGSGDYFALCNLTNETVVTLTLSQRAQSLPR